MESSNKKSVIDTLFLMSLFFVLTVTSIFTVVFGAKIYEKTQKTMESNFETRTSNLYIANKILAHDYEGGVVLDGDKLILISDDENYKTYTYLYLKDGYLQEITASESFAFDYQDGSKIMPMHTFDVIQVSDNVLKVSIVSDEIDKDFYITVMSGVGQASL